MIVFACPNPDCRKRYKVPDDRAGKTATCANPACGMRIQVPHPLPKPDPVPADLLDEETGAALKDWRDDQPEAKTRAREPEPEHDDPPPRRPRRRPASAQRYEPSIFRPSRRTSIRQANRVVAGVGAALLLIGLFLPMVNLPFGIWMSFVDLPWKAVTIGLNVAAEAEEERGKPTQQRAPQRVEPPRRVGGSEKKSDDVPGVVTAVAAIGTLYPVCISVMIAAAFFQICGGKSRGAFTVLGGMSLSVTLVYGVALLALSTQKDFRNVMVFTSPGFGWAVVLIGALALTGSGMIRSDYRN
jgi:hypothetical protein